MAEEKATKEAEAKKTKAKEETTEEKVEGKAKKETAKEAKKEESTKEEEATKEKAKPVKPTKKKKAKKRLVPEGKAYIQASYNNTIVTITDPNGEVIAWSSAGSSGFRGPKKATPFAAQTAAENAVTKAKVFGVERVHVFIKGAGNGREQAIRGLQSGGLNVEAITDTTAITHNGCRPPKTRRV